MTYIIEGTAPILFGRPLLEKLGVTVDYQLSLVDLEENTSYTLWRTTLLDPNIEYHAVVLVKGVGQFLAQCPACPQHKQIWRPMAACPRLRPFGSFVLAFALASPFRSFCSRCRRGRAATVNEGNDREEATRHPHRVQSRLGIAVAAVDLIVLLHVKDIFSFISIVTM
eukprot:s1628_g5.t1